LTKSQIAHEARLDFGRDAVIVLALSAGLYLLGIAMLLRVDSRPLALAALVVAVVILGIALRDWLDAVVRVGGAFPGSRSSHSAGSWRVSAPSRGSPSAALTGAGEGPRGCPVRVPRRLAGPAGMSGAPPIRDERRECVQGGFDPSEPPTVGLRTSH